MKWGGNNLRWGGRYEWSTSLIQARSITFRALLVFLDRKRERKMAYYLYRREKKEIRMCVRDHVTCAWVTCKKENLQGDLPAHVNRTKLPDEVKENIPITYQACDEGYVGSVIVTCTRSGDYEIDRLSRCRSKNLKNLDVWGEKAKMNFTPL